MILIHMNYIFHGVVYNTSSLLTWFKFQVPPYINCHNYIKYILHCKFFGLQVTTQIICTSWQVTNYVISFSLLVFGRCTSVIQFITDNKACTCVASLTPKCTLEWCFTNMDIWKRETVNKDERSIGKFLKMIMLERKIKPKVDGVTEEIPGSKNADTAVVRDSRCAATGS